MNSPDENISIKREESSFTGVPFPPNAGAAHKDAQSIAESHHQVPSIKQEPISPQESTHIQHGADVASLNDDIDALQINGTPQNHENVPVGQVLPDQPNLKIIKRQITNYVGFANLPKQWHRKSIRNGFNFNLLCVGKSGLGKTTLINSLFNQDFNDVNSGSLGENNNENNNEEDETNEELVKLTTNSTMIEENGVRLKLTVIETPGFANHINNTNVWEPIVSEINHRFDQYLDYENKINRTSFDDMRVHACLYFIEPTGHCLTPLDLEFCNQIHNKCNLIPVIAKSDIMSDEEITTFKNTIVKQLMDRQINIFRPPIYKLDDNDTREMATTLYDTLPYAVVGSNEFIQDPNNPSSMIRGRQYPWGVLEVENSNHSDFHYLRDLLIRQYLEELREKTNNVLYENYRSSKLVNLGIKQDNSVFKEFDPLARQEEEQKLHEAKLAKLESEMKSVFQQKVNEKEKKLQKSETELFARHKEMKDKLMKQLKALEEKKHQLEMSISTQMNTASPVPQKKKGFLR